MNQYLFMEYMMGLRAKFAARVAPSWMVFCVDLAIVIFSILLAFALRYNFEIPAENFKKILVVSTIVVLVKSLIFYFIRLHTNIIRYTSIRDLFRIVSATLVASLILACLDGLYYLLSSDKYYYTRLSVLVIDFFITTSALIFTRMLVKLLYSEWHSNTNGKTNTIIFGTEELAVSVKRALDLDPDSSYKFVAFIDTGEHTQNKKLEGVDIFHYKKLDFVIKKYGVKALIIARTQISSALKNLVIEKCLKQGVKVMSVSDVKSWLNGGVDLRKIRNIRIEDLLEREPITLDVSEIQKQLSNKTILITGAAGSIGSEIVRQICNFSPYKVILLDQGETPLHNLELELNEKAPEFKIEYILGDITNPTKLKHIFENNHIDVIYHAAAYKHVPMMERHPAEAVRNNIYGTKLLADMAIKFKVSKFVMISTDKAVNPTNVMGASKRIAEMYCQSLNEFGVTSFITTRFGNVLGSNGSVIPLFKKQIENGGPVTVTDPEVTRYFMTIPEACQLVLEASAMGKGGEIFIFDMGKSVKIVDLAKNMIRLAGLIPGKDIEIKFTGLRPGEKLYEELLAKEENTIPTYHPKIMIAKVIPDPFEVVVQKVNRLINLAETGDKMEIVAMMKEIVPDFKSHNSIYRVLDVDKKAKMQVPFSRVEKN
ncbi:MAG TPA: nucleoside-diphosphate sugar epimerase/dehydratase [Bacteroidales bacterium]|nr:nucleoside-diphosphate sugar epimerase/dehydratase [Bacteroidales bacterium]HPO64737.1 nucleoside-diphosphate sugar epimerase/dehydratase [Bacteroidales bacterium]